MEKMQMHLDELTEQFCPWNFLASKNISGLWRQLTGGQKGSTMAGNS